MATAQKQRLEFVDWLRIAAVLILFPFHAGEIFTPGDFYIKDRTISMAVRFINSFIYQWHMPLFMFLAGIGSGFALQYRSGRGYLLERTKRLLVPLVFGIFVIIPPQSYLRLFGDPARVWPVGFSHNAPAKGYDENFFQFYPSFFNGIFPDGNFEWGHLWFLAYLFTFSLLALPVFLYLKEPRGERVAEFCARLAEKKYGLLLFALPIAVCEISLRWRFPGLQNLVADWANFLTYITVFIYGYVLIGDERLLKAVDRIWGKALAAGIVLDLALTMGILIAAPGRPGPVLNVTKMIVRSVTIWCSLLGILGFGRRFLNRVGGFLDYAREAALPFYIIHQTAVIVAGFYIVRLDMPLAVKYIVITVAAFAVTALLYEFAVRRFTVTRFLFGMKRRSSP